MYFYKQGVPQTLERTKNHTKKQDISTIHFVVNTHGYTLEGEKEGTINASK